MQTTFAPTVAPYGTWESRLGVAQLTADAVELSEPALDGSTAYWLERRPEDAGRTTLVRWTDGDPTDVLPALPNGSPVDVGSRVHEYGGASYAVANGLIVLSCGSDDRLYRLDPGATELVPLTVGQPERFGDLEIDVARGVVYAVREDHGPRAVGPTAPVNEIVAVPLDGSAAANPAAVRVLVSGPDFVTSPRLSPDGLDLAWLAWDHPAMPWTSTTLNVAAFQDDGTLGTPTQIAGGNGVAVAQPIWSPRGELLYVDDSTGWLNLYRAEGPTSNLRIRPIHPTQADFSMPQWGLGTRSIAIVDDAHVAATIARDGHWSLVSVNRETGQLETLVPEWEPVGGVAASDRRFLVVAATADTAPVMLLLNDGVAQVLRESTPRVLQPADVSIAEALTWPSGDGVAYGFYYPPTNSRFTAPAEELPPLIVQTHSGPTSATTATFQTKVQFWTSRGFAVLDVNYGGSTGYGRAYQDRLNGAWGIVDVADCAAGAQYLVDIGRVDPARLGIRGGSAGGFTTLAALTFTDLFTAGASTYGIGDLAALATDTHKFEARYLDTLVAPYPEQAHVYRERSPIHHTDQLNAPMILLQGLEDRVVPPSQARSMAAAVRAKGLPVALVEFPGEAHGFRQAATIHAAYHAELSFYGQVWGFVPAGDVPVLPIENLVTPAG
jgi:dipeptidyl aminopeptidase/acylaminoacyl peptidase